MSQEKCKNEVIAPILSVLTFTKCASSLTISIQIGKNFTILFICTALQDQWKKLWKKFDIKAPMYKRQVSAMGGGGEIIGLLLFWGRIFVPATAFSVVFKGFWTVFEVFL